MAGVWQFNENGVIRLNENKPMRKALIYMQTNEVITSYASLEQILLSIGWKRYEDDPDLLQFHKPSFIDHISLPLDFSCFGSVHMYDIIVKNQHNKNETLFARIKK